MASSNKNLAVLSASNKKPPTKKSANFTWGNHMKALVNVPELSDALENISSYVTALWNRDNAVEYETTQLKCDDLEASYNTSKKTKDQHTTKIAKTDPRVSSAKIHGGEDEEGNVTWDIKDVWLFRVLLLGAVAAVCLGAANVYANLMGAELPIFIQSPWLAFTLSMLLPVGSLAIKFMTSIFRYDSSRQLFALCLYTTTTILVLIWSYLFAESFASVTGGGIDVEALLSGSGDSHGTMLVWVQLLVELLAGSCLFVASESIAIKYHPAYSCENPEYLDTKRAAKEHQPKHETLRDELGELRGKLKSMDADRDALINQHIAEFIAYRERVNAANNLNY